MATQISSQAKDVPPLDGRVAFLRQAGEGPRDVAHALAALFEQLGVIGCYGLTGGALAKLVDALGHSALPVVHFRHESGAAFAALEASLATGRPAVVFATTGPGITNALTGLMAARSEGGKVILLSAATAAQLRGRGACQDTTWQSLPSALFDEGPLFHYAATLEHPAQLEVVATRLCSGLARPGGFVAHVSVPTTVYGLATATPRTALHPLEGSAVAPETVRECAQRLESGPFVIWAGFGARSAAPLVRALAERAGAPVMCSPRAKGVFPEHHPLYLGVTGLGGHDEVEAYFAAHRPAHVLVLGTRMGEPTSYWSAALVPSEALIHVDIDPGAHGAAYPAVPTFAVTAEIETFLTDLVPRMRPRQWSPLHWLGPPWQQREDGLAQREGPVRAGALFAEVQRQVVEDSDAVILSESGNAFAWANHLLRFQTAYRYRVSIRFGSMAHAAAGVVGIALALRRKAVALVGDGSMLMLSEVSTAVRTRAPAVWIVLNDSRYGMVEEGMHALGLDPVETAIPEVDFSALARAVGAQGGRVSDESELKDGLAEAMAARGPYVLDVRMDRHEAGPWLKRIQALIAQGQGARRLG